MDQKELNLLNELNPLVNNLGYAIVKISINECKDTKNNILQIMIAKENKEPININDCSKVSKEVSEYFNNKVDFLENYALEVSSPGINRPLVFLKDFIEYKGSKVNIKIKNTINNLNHLKGVIILDVKQDIIKYKKNNQEFEILFSNIDYAELDFDLSIKSK